MTSGHIGFHWVAVLLPGMRSGLRSLGSDDRLNELVPAVVDASSMQPSQRLVPEVIERARGVAGQADLLLAVGSTLQVYPAASVVPTAKAAGARVVIVNAEPTPFDDIADAVLRDPIGEVLPAIVGRLDAADPSDRPH